MSVVTEVLYGAHQAQSYTGAGSGLTSIPRSALVAGSAGHILVNDVGGLVSSAARVLPAQGGTGLDTSSSSGYVKLNNGTWSFDTNLGVTPTATATGGTGVDSSAATGIPHVTGGSWSFSQIVNSDVSNSAAIARSKIASGTASHVLINDGTGVFASEARLAPSRGGTGFDSSASSGLAKVNGGSWSFSALIDGDISNAAAISRTKVAAGTASQVVINDGTGVLSSEARLANTRGGTGQDSSASTGVAKVAAGTWSFATIVNTDVNASASIARSKLATGIVGHVVVNDSTGAFSSEAQLSVARGGTGLDLSSIGVGPYVLQAASGSISASTIFTTAATANTIAQRGANGDLAVAALNATSLNILNSDIGVKKITGSLVTSSNTSTPILTFTIPAGINGGYGRVSVQLVYANRNGSTLSVGNRTLSFKLNIVGGTMAVSGLTQSITDNDTALTSTSVSISTSGANAILSVTGIASTSITWNAQADVTYASF